MRRTRRIAPFAVALSCLLLSAPVQAAARPAAPSADRAPAPVVALRQPGTIVPLTADLEISRSTGKSTTHVYRDSQGRTRQDTGSSVTITDPGTRTTVYLDVADRTFRRVTSNPTAGAPAPGSDMASASGSRPLSSAPRALGTTQMQGVRVEGQAYTVTIPAYKTRPALHKEVTIWLSTDVQLPVQTKVVDSSGQQYTQTYTNIRAGVEPAASLFTVPAGYRPADAPRAATQATTSDTSCPLLNEPDPLVLESFGPALGSGVINATTDPQRGCIFFADSWVFEYPLEGFRTVPLGLPFDQWFVYDNGGLLPFVPYVAFGDIAFLATNFTEDATVKDSFIILTVFF